MQIISKHTPGPWQISWNTFNGGENHGIYSNGELDLKGHQIAIVNWWPTLGTDNEQQGKANAKLISAAPDLLYASVVALEMLIDRGLEDSMPAKLLKEAINKTTK